MRSDWKYFLILHNAKAVFFPSFYLLSDFGFQISCSLPGYALPLSFKYSIQNDMRKKIKVDLAIKYNHSNCRSLYWEASDQKVSLSRVRFGVFSQSALSYHTWKQKFTSNIHMLSKFSHCSTSKYNMHTYWCHVERGYLCWFWYSMILFSDTGENREFFN